jgi:1-deoxy-D-xylulose-5-phosphate reductoisomerase
MNRIAVLGSTGSIGRATLEVVGAFPDRFEVAALAAGRSLERLAEQVRAFRPRRVAVGESADVPRLRQLLAGAFSGEILAGAEGLEAVAAESGADIVVAGLVGAVGLPSSLAAIRAGKRLALANKETMVVAGALMASEARRCGAEILPVDSEHNAIHQAMRAGRPQEVVRLVLTASGGPFRTRDLATFEQITVDDALAHPTWKMGPKITVDSATMMNKGLEVIEAHHLFGVPPQAIDVVIHPQSTIHSFVEFADGSLIAQVHRNDMRFPILYALSYPERLVNPFGRLDLLAVGTLAFEPVDSRRYPALALAREALSEGGGAPAVLNAANEIAVAAFLGGKIRFSRIVKVVAETRDAIGPRPAPGSVEEALALDAESRRAAERLIAREASIAV